jgi:hydroxyacylglutathione hydrolase
MILQRFYDPNLAQASYLIGCAATGEAIIVDPNRDIDQYVQTAEVEGLRVSAVTETHIHADFVSGSRELAERVGARLYLSREGGEDWQYAFAGDSGATLVSHGDHFMVGNIRFDVLHTPGHTPEHICFVVTDTAGATGPMGVLTGDFVFVGDVGRPDLLEKAAHVADATEGAARALFRSLQDFKAQPDHLQVWPAHGAGSACGKGMSAVPQSTVGYERLFNWAFEPTVEDTFVAMVQADQPEPPKYFGHMKHVNRAGPPILGGFRRPPRVDDARIIELIRDGAIVIDGRSKQEFSEGHHPGTVNIPLGRSFTTWAGWLVPYDREFYLIVPDARDQAVEEAVRDLTMIGLERIAGYAGSSAIANAEAHGVELERIDQIDSRELAERMEADDVAVIDVRAASEWKEGHLPGVPNIHLGYLADRLDELPAGRPVVLQCRTGGRSTIAASLLRAHGRSAVLNLTGGFVAWQEAGLPVVAE